MKIKFFFKVPENDTLVEPAPLPAKIAAPLEYYEKDGEDFPEDLYEQDAIKEEEKRVAAEALRAKVYLFSDYFDRKKKNFLFFYFFLISQFRQPT